MFFLSLLMNSRLVQALVGGALLVAIFFGWLVMHDRAIREKATLEFNQKQQEIVRKNEAELKLKDEQIRQTEEEIRKIIQLKDAEVNDLELQINENAAKEKGGDNPSSDYLKSIIKQLNDAYGVK
jgi:predicted phage gp36 major capsid-like protein